MSLAKKILSNTFIQFAGRVVSALLAMISVKLITQSLGVEGYGMYATVYEFVGLFAVAGDLGLYTITVREISEHPENEQKIYSNVLAIRSTFTAVVMVFVAVLGFFIPKYSGTPIPVGIVVCTVAVWLNLFQSILTSALQVRLKMQYATYALLAGKIASVAMIYAITLYDISSYEQFVWFIASGILGHFVMVLFAWKYTSSFLPILFEYDFSYWKSLLKKSLPYGLALIFSTIYFKVDVTLLSLLSTSEDVGYYGLALRIIEVIVVLPLFFMNSLLPSLTKAKDDAQEFLRYFLSGAVFMTIISLPILAGFWLFAPFIVRVVSSETFLGQNGLYGSDHALKFLSFALVLSFFSTLCSFSLVAQNEQKKVMIVNGCGALFNVVTNIYFIPLYGFMGAVGTSIFSEGLILVLSLYFCRKFF
jgi:O-antigen/teichoic acid export membrane protein